ncbi:DUF72 domain-containing protein [Limibacter armeniacum]|uniref:DUF72 domain-containing protein n=1 Tax=Limibacter armeniacum TaxID=466084 RepID=UPI002FE55BF0
MEFGKLHDINGVDFTMPEDHPLTSVVLSRNKQEQGVKFTVGCPAWSCKEWQGKIYPPGLKPKDFLEHYARHFSNIELNSTHYGIPKDETILRWKESVPDGFQFCPKVPQKISHWNRLERVAVETEDFCRAMGLLGDKLGVSFMQLPPNFTPNEFGKLAHFIENFPTEIPLSIEFRHEEWFLNDAIFQEITERMESRGISTVITDVAGRRDVLHQRLTTPIAVIRFVGNRLDITDYRRLDDWVVRLKDWISQGLKEVYFFLHQPSDVLCPEAVIYFVNEVNKALGLNLEVPKMLNTGVQKSLF